MNGRSLKLANIREIREQILYWERALGDGCGTGMPFFFM